ncbi:G-type lectin S-receptor-like serine/threonine-protein kinase At1g11330 [Cornus florida]|uniref:G-type lectin S-receptor-like serine/threonine-protein kinase At1g11330 n=1 Tax=Cornus florida TaxID=4283 RepID=UPI00289B9015|nr:G-type lectin S-receptor-like serine/threonine-protein kinase At1g11330 [Cornus florida]
MVRPSLITLLLIFYCSCSIEFCTAIDTITSTQPIHDPQTIASSGATFKLGFCSPSVNSTNRYVGIWYNDISAKAVVWVANRDTPLNDSSGIVTISKDGNLVVLNGQKQIVWSSDVPNASVNSSAQLSDSGNLMLRDDSNGNIIWESFKHPSDSLLQGMKISTNKFTGKKTQLTSWKSPSVPSSGRYTFGVNPTNIPEVYVWNGSLPYWRSGPWNRQIFIGTPYMSSTYYSRSEVANDERGNVCIGYTDTNKSSQLYYTLSSNGTLMQRYREKGKETWETTWVVQNTECEAYGKCGPFGSCNAKGLPICTCLQGFDPKDMEEWSRGNWSGQLIDIQEFSYGGADLYIRVAYSELGIVFSASKSILTQVLSQCLLCFTRKKRSTKLVIAVAVLIGSVTIAICIYLSLRWMARPRGRKKKSGKLFKRGEVDADCSNKSMLGDDQSQIKLEELPLFSFEKLAIATDDFDRANKLGQGGFGPVYKRKLASGQDIAVKRLSRSSGQGHEEFMNEVVVISQLQHRNLVRLLGCCVEGEEKMLIYEYMLNKSLDAFLFDPIKQKLLDWRKRANIIEGIGRGLLYLHRDSRLRIIHRDLKASNILLDSDLNPKISDFGIAKIFGGNQDQANTKRVVGTYGYMAPEYAMKGRFSEKPDVFSFRVLLLEILSGRKNTSFYHDEHSLSLLGFAWKLWNEDRIAMLIDPTISDPCFLVEILRYIQVGLLRVQDFATNRPTINTALFMFQLQSNLHLLKHWVSQIYGLFNKARGNIL